MQFNLYLKYDKKNKYILQINTLIKVDSDK